MPIEEAELWLRDNGLDVEEVCSPSTDGSDELAKSTACDAADCVIFIDQPRCTHISASGDAQRVRSGFEADPTAYQRPPSLRSKARKRVTLEYRLSHPPPDASQAIVDRWAEETFTRRWRADIPSVPGIWAKEAAVGRSDFRT